MSNFCCLPGKAGGPPNDASTGASGQSSLAFFPLYSMLMRALAWPFGGSDRTLWMAGIALSYASLFLGLTDLQRLSETVLGGREAARPRPPGA